jgi:adenylate cyclase
MTPGRLAAEPPARHHRGVLRPARLHRLRRDLRAHELSHRIGIAQGYATLGAIGFEGRWDYGAIGTVTNLAARLCGEAAGGEILVSQRVHAGVQALVEAEAPQSLALKGFSRPVAAWRVAGLKASA